MKTNILKVMAALLLTTVVSTSYAITVNVHSTSSHITGLGFKANGSKHGGMGQNYEGKDMPKGSYAFGVRTKGKDVPCTSNGKRSVKLTNDADVTLVVKGSKCTVKMNS
jgi:hypothetical protein